MALDIDWMVTDMYLHSLNWMVTWMKGHWMAPFNFHGMEAFCAC